MLGDIKGAEFDIKTVTNIEPNNNFYKGELERCFSNSTFAQRKT